MQIRVRQANLGYFHCHIIFQGPSESEREGGGEYTLAVETWLQHWPHVVAMAVTGKKVSEITRLVTSLTSPGKTSRDNPR